MRTSEKQWIRKCSLILWAGDEKSGGSGLDLSNLRIQFHVRQGDVSTPDNAYIRIFNVRAETAVLARKEFNNVILQAGYQESEAGQIFKGTVRTYAWGRVDEVNTYLDVFAADGDIPFNWTILNQTIARGASAKDVYKAIASKMGLKLDFHMVNGGQPIFPRSRVLFGLAKASLNSLSQTIGATWKIQNGKLVVKPLDGYLPGDPLEINMQTGLVGIPTQTVDGVRVRTLLNPRLSIGTRVRLNNSAIAQSAYVTAAQNVPNDPNSGIPYNRFTGRPEYLASVAQGDGEYMVFVIDHTGDTRGPEWYSDLVLLSIDPTSQKVIAN